ncbi:DJ-1/PfpI family protein [uncultured Megasphaera sp.]|uniref:DJ-1/PfpI family protein n=1 Tax=Megasphaera massiliensis TaxID=1232428 RepID=UPI00266C88C4|nr:DJ-1/PfpI family protein [uncultured Megasphaera sp.]
MMKNVYVVLYEDFTALDAFGPVEVLGSIEEFQLHFVSLEGGVITNKQAVRIETEPMAAMEKGGILLIPGGWGSRAEVNHEAFIKALGRAVDEAEYVLCVCTGSALVAKTGALDGLRATSNKRAFAWVESCRPEVTWEKPPRWVRDGKFYTSAGVSAGIDMALGFIRDRYGEERALEICTRMEYRWNRNADECLTVI